MGSLQKIMRRTIKKKNLPSRSVKAITNRAGGVAFNIKDASTKLITMTGGSFFAEPRYYSESACNSRDSELLQRLEVIENSVKDFNCEELDDVAKEIISTALSIINSSNPKDILSIANWLRNECNIRLTPQVLLVLASRFDETKGFVREYASKIVKRPDEVKTCLMLHRYFFGKKCLSKALDHGLGDVLSKVGEAALLKYEGNSFPRWRDVMNWLSRKSGRPFKKSLADYFMDGKVCDDIPIIRDRELLNKKIIFDNEAKKLALFSKANWEVLVSQFGNRREIWDFLISSDLLGYMATLRNMRNILNSDCSQETLNIVYNKISSKEEVLNSKQLPFRFLSAYKELESLGQSKKISKFLEALEGAMEVSVENCPVLKGASVVAIDVSGSMCSPISKQSSLSIIDAACILGSIIAKRCEDVYLWSFAEGVKEVNYTKHTGIMELVKKIRNNGGSTNTHLVIKKMEDEKIYPERLVILSDMQAWDSCWGRENCADLWKKYQRNKRGKNVWSHSVHLNGYGDTPFDEDNKVNLLSGFNEKVLDQIVRAEGMGTEEKVLPSITYIRQNF